MSTRLKQDISMEENLQALRQKAGLSQEAVVTKLALMGISPISRAILSQMEYGKYSIPISVLLALKDRYQASFEDFFQGLYWQYFPIDKPNEHLP